MWEVAASLLEEGQSHVSSWPMEAAVLSASLTDFHERMNRSSKQVVDSLLVDEPSSPLHTGIPAGTATTNLGTASNTSGGRR